MSDTNRGIAALAAFVSLFGNRAVRQEPVAAFRKLREHVGDLEPGDIAVGADLAKQISSEMRATAHRLIQDLVNEERKNAR
jgi:hypothetical protein